MKVFNDNKCSTGTGTLIPGGAVSSTGAQYNEPVGGLDCDSLTDLTMNISTPDFEESDFFSNIGGVIKVENAGLYDIDSFVTISGAASNYRYQGMISIWKNGSILLKALEGGYIRSSNGHDTTYLNIEHTVELEALDTLEIKIKRTNTTTGTAATVADQSQIRIRLAETIAGAEGPRGFKGDTGDTGIQGIQGVAGSDGSIGLTGASGSDGVQGDAGSQGIQGIQGTTGATGANGNDGENGTDGVKGNIGNTGDTGIQGIQGVAGSQGLQGIQGTTGATGADGNEGLDGAAGANGSQGIQGIQGIQGEQGEQGESGTGGGGGLDFDTAINSILVSVNFDVLVDHNGNIITNEDGVGGVNALSFDDILTFDFFVLIDNSGNVITL